MGNHRFRLSDMMPNAWFYKLKDMGRNRNRSTSHPTNKKLSSPTPTTQKSHHSQARYSYYFTEPDRAHKVYNSPINPKASDTHFPDPPRKSSTRKARRRTIYKPSPRPVSSGCSCHATLNSVWSNPAGPTTEYQDYFLSPTDSSPEPDFNESPPPELESDAAVASDSFDGLELWSSSCGCTVSSSTTDIIIDVNNNKSLTRTVEKEDEFNTISKLELPPILTKPAKFNDSTVETTKFRRGSSKLEEIKARGSISIKIVKEGNIRTQKEPKGNALVRKSSAHSVGVKLRSNSPRLASRKIQAYARKSVSSTTASKARSRSLSESFAIVKSSIDPQRDFRDSMMEMIVENNIRASKDLEELLACYLSLNASEYHALIVKAFEQIWFDLTDFRM